MALPDKLPFAEYRDGQLFFSEYQADHFLALANQVCKVCPNYWFTDPQAEIPACIPPDIKDPQVTTSAGFQEELAKCIHHFKIDPHEAKLRNLERVLFSADQDAN